MKYEVEQKFRLADPAALVARLAALGCELGPAIEQADHYFAHPARDFAATDEALRIRSVGSDNWVTYKGPKIDTTTKTRRELELPIESGAAGAERFAELLRALGFRPVATVQKSRWKVSVPWSGRDIELVLDEVAGLGSFCELELSADDHDLDRARQLLGSLAGHLGLTEVERRSYLEMLLAQ